MSSRLHSRPRGAALLVVMVAVAVLTTLALDLAYDTRVSLRIAANARDELQATYLAKSGVALSRLVLTLQQDVDTQLASLNVPGGMSVPRPQLWRLVPVDSSLVGAFFGGGVPAAQAALAEAAETGAAPEGPAAGTFEVSLDDEGRKVNVQLEAAGQAGGMAAAQVQALYQLVCNPSWDPLFDREDENGLRVSRQDLIVYLRDWVDDKEVTSALAASFPPGGCVMLTRGNPFEDGFGDENFPYDRGEDRYRAKNARMDSLAELHLVAGVTDAFMAAFGDAMTVYLPRDGAGAKLTLNELDPARLLWRAAMIAVPQNQPGLYDPEVARRLAALVAERTLGGILALSSKDFGQLAIEAGITVDTTVLEPTSTNNPFTDRSSVFRIRSRARAGDVVKTLDAVVRFDTPRPGQAAPPPTQGQGAATPGWLVHWREE